MAARLREKIFGAALLAVAVLFLLQDEFVMKPAMNLEVAQFIDGAYGTPSDSTVIDRRVTRRNRIVAESLLKQSPVQFTPSLLNLLNQAIDNGTSEGRYRDFQNFQFWYGRLKKQDDTIRIDAVLIDPIMERYDGTKSKTMTYSLVALVMAMIYSHLLALKIKKG